MSKQLEQLEVGAIATWTSQASGTTATKQGEVIAFIPGKSSINRLFPWVEQLASSQVKISQWHSQNDRYLVRVDRASKSGASLQPWYYAPRASAVKAVEKQS